jgi:hypothetical protein
LERLDKSECRKEERSGGIGSTLMMRRVGGARRGALLVPDCSERCAGRAVRGGGDGDKELGESALRGN